MSSGSWPIIHPQLFEARIKANEFVQENLKQIATVAVATLAFTVTFLKDVILNRYTPISMTWLLAASWGLLALSVGVAILTLAILVNNLDWDNGKEPQKSFAAGTDQSIQLWVLATNVLFIAGICCFAAFGIINYSNLLNNRQPYKVSTEIQAIQQIKSELPNDDSLTEIKSINLLTHSELTSKGGAIWHIQVNVNRLNCRKNCQRTIDYFINANNGEIESIP